MLAFAGGNEGAPPRVRRNGFLVGRAFLFGTLLLGVVCGVTNRASGAEPDAGKVIKPDADLVGHWRLAGDVRDSSGKGRHGTNRGVDLQAVGRDGKAGTAAGFDGQRSWVEVPGQGIFRGKDDFTISLHIHTESKLDDLIGDLISQYDPAKRRGVNFGVLSLPGSTNSQPNDRNVQFGIDNGKQEPKWTDHGRPGNAVLIFGMAVHDGRLYVGTCEPGQKERGRIYRLGGKGWEEVGAPDVCNSITSLAVFNGELYVGSGNYRLSGSALKDSENPNFGGRIFKYVADGKWEPCGRLTDETKAVGGMVVYKGHLYASSLYQPAGFYRYEGGTKWTSIPTPNGKRVVSLGVHNGLMYATSYDNGNVYSFDGQKFTDLGRVGKSTQVYGFLTYQGELYVANWPDGKMYRYGGGTNWIDAGRLGEEQEVMATAYYNGKMYAGSLPLAAVFRYDGETKWTNVGRLDHTPDVKYRRVWSMAVYQGRLYAGTLPSGKVFSIEYGANASVDRPLNAGWKHLTAVRRGGRLELYVDGVLSGQSVTFPLADYDLTSDKPLKIGFGENAHFRGKMSDVRIYRRALTSTEIRTLAGKTAAAAK